MPLVINQMPLPHLMGFLWFFLLFLAGITSSVSLAQPAVAFLEDEFNLSRRKAVLIFAGTAFVLCHPAVFFLKNGVVDELDFWGGTFCLVLFATIEVILFSSAIYVAESTVEKTKFVSIPASFWLTSTYSSSEGRLR